MSVHVCARTWACITLLKMKFILDLKIWMKKKDMTSQGLNPPPVLPKPSALPLLYKSELTPLAFLCFQIQARIEVTSSRPLTFKLANLLILQNYSSRFETKCFICNSVILLLFLWIKCCHLPWPSG